jgi:AraC-like DNA-binding protein
MYREHRPAAPLAPHLNALGLDLAIDPRDPAGALERWLLARLDGVRSSPVAAHAIGRLVAGTRSLSELARETGWSRQWLARECKRRVGISPKRLSRVARLQRAIIALQALATRPRTRVHPGRSSFHFSNPFGVRRSIVGA